uniref:T-complex protein 1 subunit gamma n=1 Tax=Attheya septentrionalis TaxID=420275 RepID=A0A7S2XKF7_9STRA|mmetsp:Transcript_15616/g.28388  ORF Transcript_15616/g.28388 Transcript_15616/m.28388 type:complete len:555 (+) Transcript_15616:51-1715(+)|eukprot:CAMPEP_0198286684 /NCGR_PEP_ID=MMETSP1449-20131203/5691_1 /TAXON_ID=420275 /ORGANISM="Attheya septentrionalis, Strain CCMP2084" /LENGTH=554 /DNA_ID=CAMNT_0043984469 /DNA_START=58 /DNA_END=1722 /DNA_ORIENTATION=+
MAGQPQVMVLNQNTKRETGRQAQIGNIAAARAVADIIRTTLGPRSMLKMLLDPMGGVVITNDGNCILREVDVSHPTAKSMIELSRSQDEEVGDGTTSVIILAGEVMMKAGPFINNNLHPTVIVQGYNKALQEALLICERQALVIDINDTVLMKKLVESCIGTKFSSRWNDKMVDMAIAAVLTVARPSSNSPETSTAHTPYNHKMEVDIKRYAKVEKIPGGEISDSCVLKGVMFNKDVTHSKMRRKIENPRILLLDSPLEYKKGESQTNVEITDEEDWNTMLKMEEEYVENMCMEIIAFKPDIVITEKGVSDLAQHFFAKANITAFRRLRKTDNNRVARATGATIVSRTDEIQESDIGTNCGLFEMRKIGDEYFAFLEECKDPKACTIMLRGGSKDVLNEIERNLSDAMQVVRNVIFDPKLLPGGGATEMAVATGLRRAGQKVEGVQQGPFMAVGEAMEVIPRTLAQNCGVSVIRTVTQLRAKHAAAYDEAEKSTDEKTKPCNWGINGITGDLVDMEELGIWEPFSVKVQTIKTAIESACMILRIDDIVSGSKRR